MISGVDQLFSFGMIERLIMIALYMYSVCYEDVGGCDRDVLISDNMKVTIKHTGKHEGLSWVAGGAVTMGNMVYKAYVTFEVENGMEVLFTNTTLNIGGFKLNLSFNKYTRNFKFYMVKHMF